MLAFAGLGLWGILTAFQPETKHQKIEIHSLGALTGFWAVLVAMQYALGWIPTSIEFTLLSIGYLLAALMVGVLVRMWVNAGFEHELLQAFLTAVLVVAVLNAVVILVQASPWISYVEPFIEADNPQRPGGIISQTNIAGTWCVCGLIALIFLSKDPQEKTVSISFWKMVVMVLLLWAINTTLTRIALLEIIALSVLLMVFRKPFGISQIWIGLPLWQACVHFATVVFQGFKSGSEISIYNRFTESNQSRFDIYTGVIHIIQDNPIWGISWRQFQWLQMSYPELEGALDHAHNLFLQVQLELGLAGSIGLLAFMVYWLIQKQVWSTTRPAVVVGLMVAAIFGLHSMTEYPLWYAPSLFAFSIAVAFMGHQPIITFKPLYKIFQFAWMAYLLLVAWVYVDHKMAYERIVQFMMKPHAVTEQDTQSFWFKTYDDYMELQNTDIDQFNHVSHTDKVIQLTNYLTPAMPLHALLKIYVYSQQNHKAVGLARKICKMNPQLWKNTVIWHVTQGPTPMKKWILSQEADVIQCTSPLSP
ncbi:MAG: Wzy polymerase domain-containing protein [Limnohabitans sp.]